MATTKTATKATRKITEPGTFSSHGVEWSVGADGRIRVLVNVNGRDCGPFERAGYEVDWADVPTGRNWDSNASWVSVPREAFDAFIGFCLKLWDSYEDVELFANVDDHVRVGDALVQYEDLPSAAWQTRKVWVSLGGIPRDMQDVKSELTEALGEAFVSVEGDPELTPVVTVRGLRMEEIEEALADVVEGVFASDPQWEQGGAS